MAELMCVSEQNGVSLLTSDFLLTPSHVSPLLIPLTQVFQACGKPRDGGTGVEEQLMIGQYTLDNMFERNSGKIDKLVSIWPAHSVFL